jgi:hypothetical protein
MERPDASAALPIDAAIGRLREIYADLDAAVASLGARCAACGACCTFPRDGPVLYATAVERRFLRSVPPRRVGPSGRACPYLDPDDNRCEARERRTIGCRTHFCSRALPSDDDRRRAHELCESALGRLAEEVHARGLPWDYAPVVGEPD